MQHKDYLHNTDMELVTVNYLEMIYRPWKAGPGGSGLWTQTPGGWGRRLPVQGLSGLWVQGNNLVGSCIQIAIRKGWACVTSPTFEQCVYRTVCAVVCTGSVGTKGDEDKCWPHAESIPLHIRGSRIEGLVCVWENLGANAPQILRCNNLFHKLEWVGQEFVETLIINSSYTCKDLRPNKPPLMQSSKSDRIKPN